MSHADRLAQDVAAAMYSREGPSEDLGLKILEVGAGFARVGMIVTAKMLNGHGTIHGGMIFTLADTAFAYACNSANVVSVAQQASISFLSPAHEGEQLIAEARQRAHAGRSGVCEVLVTGPHGKAVAVFQGLSRSLGRPVIPHEPGAQHD